MFFNNFKYFLKIILRNRMLIFWTFLFPIILGTFFKMAFSNIENSESLDIINIAIINDENYEKNMFFREALKNLSEGKEKIFSVKLSTESDAKKLLDDKDISGYLKFLDNSVVVYVKNSGINETIIKYVVNYIQSKKETLDVIISEKFSDKNINLAQADYINIYNEVKNILSSEANINDISRTNMSYTMVEFYTLIAMACLYGSMISMTAINYIMPTVKSVGKRVGVSAMERKYLVLGGLCSSFIVQLIGILILFLYTIFVLKIDFGDNLFYILLLSIVGSLCGMSLGIFMGTTKFNESLKIGILISVTMFWSFLSGMMGVGLKYVFDRIPIVNKINPANLITDGFYSLYYYGVGKRFYINLISLLLFTVTLIIISFYRLRRQKYDSI